MTEQDVIKSIEQHRSRIDAIDQEIVALLNERAQEALSIRSLKPQAQLGLYDPRREEEIFERVEDYNKGPLFGDDLRSIYTAILKVSKEMRS
ncbi:MAG: chorismate mutase [Coriobacteriales bacterium]|jgi:chorismate mutase|nr:chorismate mutase [Coriobacteriales bacterium]